MTKEQNEERKRVLKVIFDYCFTERKGKGCLGCPLSDTGACDSTPKINLRSLHEAEQIITDLLDKPSKI